MSAGPARMREIPPQEAARRARRRVRLLALAFMLAFAAVGARLFEIQRLAPAPRPEIVARGAKRLAVRREIVDRHGRLLATNVRTLALAVDPARLPDPEEAARQLAAILEGVDAARLRERLRPERRFAWVKRRLSAREQQAVQELGLPGIIFVPTVRRVYPQRALFAHLLGAVGVDGQGLAGAEGGLDRLLRAGDEAGPLALSVDLRVQQALREELQDGFRRFRASGACGLVMDVRSGELLALVSLPDFDPNAYGGARPEQRRDRCTGSVYELGSLFKLVSVAAALDSGAVTLRDRFDARMPLRIGRHRIDDDHARRRWLTVPEILAFSSNIGTVQMIFAAGGAGRERRYLERLGLAGPLAIELVERERPLFPRRWPDIVAATVSYGHGIAVTPLHFAQAVAALAHDGRLRPATLLAGGRAPTRGVLDNPRIIDDLRWLMWLVVERGTGTRAQVPAYLVGGKTGTADKPAPGGGYRSGQVVASFLGVFPVEDPRYLVLVLLDEPKGDRSTFGFRYGGWTAAPVVARVIERIGPLLGVPPSSAEARARFAARLAITPAFNGRTGRMEDGLAALDAGG